MFLYALELQGWDKPVNISGVSSVCQYAVHITNMSEGNPVSFCEILGSHGDADEDSGLPGCDVVTLAVDTASYRVRLLNFRCNFVCDCVTVNQGRSRQIGKKLF